MREQWIPGAPSDFLGTRQVFFIRRYIDFPRIVFNCCLCVTCTVQKKTTAYSVLCRPEESSGMISLSYSRISLADIAEKLQLDSAEDAEYIVAKAIRDGVIEASIDHEQGFMRSKESTDIYASKEPQEAFHQRILFCLDLYNQSLKAMRYPPKAYRKDFESVEERREREQQDLELAKEMAEDEEEEGF